LWAVYIPAPLLPLLPLPLPAHRFMCTYTRTHIHFTTTTTLRWRTSTLLHYYFLLTNGHCSTEPLQQKGDGRIAYNYTWWWRWRRRSTSLRLVLTTGPQPNVIISGDRRRCCCVLRRWRRRQRGGSEKNFHWLQFQYDILCALVKKKKKTRTYTAHNTR